MENLPRDILLNIFSRLPIISFSQIKCVCKAWLALAQHPLLLNMLSDRANQRNPSLILHCDSPIVNKLCYISSEEGSNNYSSKVLKIVPPFMSNMQEYQVVGSCNGLVCISDALHFDPIYVCNIFSGDYIELPKTNLHHHLEHLEQVHRCNSALGFGYVQSTKEYKVVRVVNYSTYHGTLHFIGSEHYYVQILTIGIDNAWRSLGYTHWKLDPRPSEAFINGALHWVTNRYGTRHVHLHIVAFDLTEEKFKEIARPMCGSFNLFNFYLVNLRGCLSATICVDGRNTEIWVMQEYDVKESWTKDYVIRVNNIPSGLNRRARPKSRIWKHKRILGEGVIEVICLLKNGDILLSYLEGALVLYSPDSGSFEELVFSGLPRWFSAITHVETLFSSSQHSEYDVRRCLQLKMNQVPSFE